jgi:DNA-binding transcriptional LysR family regulator
LQTRATRRADGTSLGELRVGASTTVGNYLLPVIIGGFLTQHPDVTITLEVMKTRAVLNELREFRIDIALVEGYCRDKDFETHVWQRDRLCIVASPRHPLAGKKTASLNDLAKAKRWILRELGSSARTIFEAAIAKNVRQIEVFMELGNNEAIKTAVANDLGISCLSHLAVKPLLDSGALVEIPVPNLDLTRNLHIVVHKHKYLTKLLNSFVEFCHNSTAPCDVVSGHSRAAKPVMARRS